MACACPEPSRWISILNQHKTMPNWCENQLTVSGATPEFRVWLEEGGFSFERMNPVSSAESAPSNPWTLNDACCNAWGTKWDLEENLQREVAALLMEAGCAFFDTAWSPPLAAIDALSKRFPGATFQLIYCEMGMFFAGVATFMGGLSHDDEAEGREAVIRIACDVFGADEQEFDPAPRPNPNLPVFNPNPT